jgi:hypothetical protein
VSRDEDEEKIRVLFAELLEDFSEEKFLALESAATEKNRCVHRNAEGFEDGAEIPGWARGGGGVVELDAAGGAEAGEINAERAPARLIGRLLQAEDVDLVENRGGDGADFTEAFFGARGEAGVDEEDRDAEFFRLAHAVGPDLGLDENEGARTDESHGATGDGEEVEGIVDWFEPGGFPRSGELKAGGGGGGEDELHGGISLAEGLDQFEGDVDLADADGVDPKAPGAGDLAFDAFGVDGETLPEFMPVFSAADHAEDEPWQHDDQHHGEEQIVEKPDPENHFAAR